MSARFELRATFDHPARAVIALLTDPEFLERKARSFGATNAKARRSERVGEVVVVIDVWEPAGWGGSGTTHRTMTQTSDPVSGAGTWVQVIHDHADRSTAEGTSEIVVLGPERCELITRGTIEIRVPLLGRMIERKVVETVEAGAKADREFIAAALSSRLR